MMLGEYEDAAKDAQSACTLDPCNYKVCPPFFFPYKPLTLLVPFAGSKVLRGTVESERRPAPLRRG